MKQLRIEAKIDDDDDGGGDDDAGGLMSSNCMQHMMMMSTHMSAVDAVPAMLSHMMKRISVKTRTTAISFAVTRQTASECESAEW
jgi:hypothetical protein